MGTYCITCKNKECINYNRSIYFSWDCKKYMEGTGLIGKWKGTPVIEIPALISWLNDQKYTNVDETSDIMTEEFEKEHQWELSRNCFINNMVRKLKELK